MLGYKEILLNGCCKHGEPGGIDCEECKKELNEEHLFHCQCGWTGIKEKMKEKKPLGKYRGLTTWSCPLCGIELDFYDSTD